MEKEPPLNYVHHVSSKNHPLTSKCVSEVIDISLLSTIVGPAVVGL
jgi:hypothetical protein